MKIPDRWPGLPHVVRAWPYAAIVGRPSAGHANTRSPHRERPNVAQQDTREWRMRAVISESAM
ncbi:hypothetical protein EJ03DRAFT_74862 [Teratosphaeria nubilosa]|uniref:Uncharacterized protein n=1 Tax=Teratosphaeria nubilosa TaxID=161662 RepID=A0A6G1LN83_9PEZI|nr:hypothetical protein EJ03DRAFT_74862 [Teratosphaeria nubilosa]